MTPMEQLMAIVSREAQGATAWDPKATPSNADHEVQFTLRLESGEERVVYNIPRGSNREGREAITRIERAFHTATGFLLYVKLLNGK